MLPRRNATKLLRTGMAKARMISSWAKTSLRESRLSDKVISKYEAEFQLTWDLRSIGLLPNYDVVDLNYLTRRLYNKTLATVNRSFFSSNNQHLLSHLHNFNQLSLFYLKTTTSTLQNSPFNRQNAVLRRPRRHSLRRLWRHGRPRLRRRLYDGRHSPVDYPEPQPRLRQG